MSTTLTPPLEPPVTSGLIWGLDFCDPQGVPYQVPQTPQPTQADFELKAYITYLGGTGLNEATILQDYEIVKTAYNLSGRAGVNKVVFSDEKYKQPPATAYVLSEDQMSRLVSLEGQWRGQVQSTRITNLENDISASISRVAQYHHDIHSRMLRIQEMRREIDALKGVSTDGKIMHQQIKQVLDAGFELDNVNTIDGIINFVTPPITLSNFNRDAAVAQVVRMGQYKICVRLTNMTARVYRHKDNVEQQNGYIHPHVSSDGSVCYGNAAHAYTTAATGRDIAKIVLTTMSVLKEYGEENPYCDLSDFWVIQNPESLAGRTPSWIRDDRLYYCRDEELSVSPAISDVIERWTEDEDEEGNGVEWIKFRAWKQVYQGTNVQLKDDDGHGIWGIKAGNNRHVAVDYSDYERWEVS